MNDKPIPLVQVRNQRLFGPKAAAGYLGICEDTLKKMTDLEQLRAFNMNGRRAYRLEDLDAYVESLPGWYDSTGEKSIVGSKYWPDGTRFRRRFSNKTLAKSVLGRIEGAIAMGTWKELRKELAGEEELPDYTIREFADVYLEEYCRVRNTCVDFKEERLKTIKNIVGDLKLREFTSAHAAYFEKERAKDVVPRTGEAHQEGNH
jgi:hypothetical protein